MAEEKILAVNLRKGMERGPVYRRSALAVKFLRQSITRQLKAKEVKINPQVSEYIFMHGGKNPATKVRVLCSKDDKGVVTVKPLGVTEKKIENGTKQ